MNDYRLLVQKYSYGFKELKVSDRINLLWFQKKRFDTRGTLRGIRISRLAKIPTIYRDWLRSLN